MALVMCPDCGRPLADSATSCASCGRARGEREPMMPGTRPIFFAALGIVAATSLMIAVGAMTASRARDARGRQRPRAALMVDAGAHAGQVDGL